TLPQLRPFFPTLTTMTAHLKTRWDHAARTGAVVDMYPDLLRSTVEIITHVTFGDDRHALTDALADLQPYLGQMFALIHRRFTAPWPYWRVLTLPAERAVEAAIAAFRTMLATYLAQHRAQAPTVATPPTTLVEALLTARDEAGTALSDEEILGNVL